MPTITSTRAIIYRYRIAATPGPHRLMLQPRETRGHELATFDLEISPTARLDWSHVVVGNAIAVANFDVTKVALSKRFRTTAVTTAPDWPVFPIAPTAASGLLLFSAED